MKISIATKPIINKPLTGISMLVAVLVCGIAAGVCITGGKVAAQTTCPTVPTDRGTQTIAVSVPANATYRVWSRIMAPNTSDNSYYLQIDNTTCNVVVGDAAIAANAWTWVDYQNGATATKTNVALTAGTHTVKLIGRESNVKVDRVIMTADTSCVPTGTGNNCVVTEEPPANATEAMKGVWAIKQFGAQSGANSTFSANTMSADIAGFSARMPWRLIQTGPSTFNWTAFDNLVAAARSSGKSVRLSIMSGVQAPAQGGWVNYQYPWFQGSAGSQCDAANQTIPVPWDSGLLNAQTLLINEVARKWKTDWGSTVVAWQVTGPSAQWEELCLPDNVVSQPGYYNNSRTDNVIRKTWADTMDKWNNALTSQGISSNRMFVSVSAPPPFYLQLTDDVGNDAIAKFGSRVSLQWHWLDTGFASGVNSTSTAWKSKAMIAWQEWGATTFAGRLMGTGGGAACNTGTAADCDVATASNQDVTALNASLNLAKNAGASYVEVYDDDLKFPLLSAAAATIHDTMKGTTAPGDTTPPAVSSLAANPTTVTAGTPSTLTVNATDAVGVTRVEFFEGTTSLGNGTRASGTAQSGSWTLSYNTTGKSGTKSLTAKAYDAAGNISNASNTVTVTINPSGPKPGDSNGDGAVDGLDLSKVLTNYGRSLAGNTNGDVNNDGQVNGLDLSLVLSRFGT